jgi:hypothetical protein
VIWSLPRLFCLANCRQHRAGNKRPIIARLQSEFPNLLRHAETYAVSEHKYQDVINMMLRLFRSSDMCTNEGILVLTANGKFWGRAGLSSFLIKEVLVFCRRAWAPKAAKWLKWAVMLQCALSHHRSRGEARDRYCRQNDGSQGSDALVHKPQLRGHRC